MFPNRFFPKRFFPDRFFPPGGAEIVQTVRRKLGLPWPMGVKPSDKPVDWNEIYRKRRARLDLLVQNDGKIPEVNREIIKTFPKPVKPLVAPEIPQPDYSMEMLLLAGW